MAKRIKINVGGTLFETYEDTLTRGTDGYFNRLLSGKYEPPSLQDGAIFVDRSPRTFEHVLGFLRTGKVRWRDAAEREEILDEAQFYCIESLVAKAEIPKFNPSVRSDVEFSCDCRRALTTCGGAVTLSANCISEFRTSFKIRMLSKVSYSAYVRIGVAELAFGKCKDHDERLSYDWDHFELGDLDVGDVLELVVDENVALRLWKNGEHILDLDLPQAIGDGDEMFFAVQTKFDDEKYELF